MLLILDNISIEEKLCEEMNVKVKFHDKVYKNKWYHYKDNNKDYGCIKKTLRKLLHDEDFDDLTSCGDYAILNKVKNDYNKKWWKAIKWWKI